jgi:hypothetical protein
LDKTITRTDKRIVVFTGPSIHPKDAVKILKADYRPPVGRDDVIKALQDKPDVIAIIDGVFHQKPAVSHKEILRALKEGVTVIGGASMGALRASELDDFGMIGVGRVYSYYKNGIIEADDDVAVVFNPQTLEQLSEALVTMGYNFRLAVNEDLINEEDFKSLVQTAKSIYYPKRTYRKVLKDARIAEDKKEGLERFLDEKGIDLKMEDAVEVLKYVKENL